MAVRSNERSGYGADKSETHSPVYVAVVDNAIGGLRWKNKERHDEQKGDNESHEIFCLDRFAIKHNRKKGEEDVVEPVSKAPQTDNRSS